MATELKFPALCIPRAMRFHTAEFVENALNTAMQGKFVEKIEIKTTTDKSGAEFNVIFVHANQSFTENASTALVYKNLRDQGFVNISTGKGKFFWKVKLYVPNLKAKFAPKATTGPMIMDSSMTAEFRLWQEERNKAKKAKAVAAAEKGPWEEEENVKQLEEGELGDE